MIVAHEADCPRLKDWSFAQAGECVSDYSITISAAPKPCACRAVEQLRELVEAVEGFIDRSDENVISERWLSDSIDAIDAALAPFRSEQKEAE